MDRETVVEVGVAIAAVVSFIALVLFIGSTFGGRGLTPTGGQALVGGIVLFILLMAGAGLWLSRDEL